MPLTTIREMFETPWGIVEHCREEIESSGAGGFDRIIKRETDAHFPTAAACARMMGCSDTTARRWLRGQEVRYIHLEGATRYFIGDVSRIDALRRASKEKPA